MSDNVSLKEYFDSLREADQIAVQAALASAEKAVAAALTASEKAVDKAETGQGKVNTAQNEFRGALKDQAATLMPRAEYDVNHKALQKQIDSLQRLVYIGLGIALTLQVVLQFIKH